MVLHESRRALRNLLHAPKFSLVVITTLALAVGGAGGMFSLLNAVVLRPITNDNPDRLAVVYPATGEALFGITMPTLAELQKQQTVFDAMCGVLRGAAILVEIDGLRTRRAVEGVDGACYPLLGAAPLMGRLITDDDRPHVLDSAPVALIGYAFWQDSLGGNPNVIGTTLLVRGSPVTIVGVMPAGFRGFNNDDAPELVLPLGLLWKLNGSAIGPPIVLALHAVGRLREDVTLSAASSQLHALWPEVWKATNPPPRPSERGPFAGDASSLRVESFAGGFSELRRAYAQPLRLLVALAVLLLVLAAVNAGGLCLARTLAREREFAVARALGAGRIRLATQLTAEALLLAIAAAALAVPIAFAISGSLATMLWTINRPMTMRVTPDGAVIATIAAAAAMIAMVVSLPSSVVACFRPLVLTGSDARVVAASGSWRRALAVSQAAISLVLLFAAGLFVRNLAQIRGIDPGYSPAGLSWARLEPAFGAPRPNNEGAYLGELVARIGALPGVTGVSLSASFPASEIRFLTITNTFVREGGDAPLEAQGHMDRTWPGFFATVGIPLLAGRDFTPQDAASAPQVAIINRTLADQLYPRGDAIGGVIRFPSTNRSVTVVGVVADASPGDFRIMRFPLLYRPVLQQLPLIAPALIVRTANDIPLADALRKVVDELGPHQVASFRTVLQQTDRFLIRERALGMLSVAFAVLGVMVGALGLYGLLAFNVVRRTRELGVRMALGATHERVAGMIVREGLILMLIGIAIGVPAALAAGRLARALLFQIPASDPVSLAAAVVVLIVSGVAAAAIPAARVARLTLADTLRHE